MRRCFLRLPGQIGATVATAMRHAHPRRQLRRAPVAVLSRRSSLRRWRAAVPRHLLRRGAAQPAPAPSRPMRLRCRRPRRRTTTLQPAHDGLRRRGLRCGQRQTRRRAPGQHFPRCPSPTLAASLPRLRLTAPRSRTMRRPLLLGGQRAWHGLRAFRARRGCRGCRARQPRRLERPRRTQTKAWKRHATPQHRNGRGCRLL